jgi:hypothetical protein
MTISELDRCFCHLAGAGRVSKIGRNKIRFASRCADFGNGPLAAFSIATYDQDVDAKLR